MAWHDEPGAWRPSASNSLLRERAKLLAAIREFFAARNVTEVETPLISRSGNSDPGLCPLQAGDGDLWLRTSPEYAMKRLLAAGSGDIYELGRVFRGGESGRHHNREFTMLEWYRTGWTYHRLMDEVAELVRHCCDELELAEQRMSYRELFLSMAGLDPLVTGGEALKGYVQSRGLDVKDLDPGAYLDLVLSHVIQPALPGDTLTFVYDYPADQAALARIRAEEPPVAERFELFLGQVELANGYQELTDAAEQHARFQHENEVRVSRGEPEVRLDEALLAALQAGLPECTGVALGVDRLLMYKTGATSLAEVIPFPSDLA